MRRERTLLQHEFDTLNQKLSAELLTLKDELTGMFNDRKMAVRMEQREMDSAVSPTCRFTLWEDPVNTYHRFNNSTIRSPLR